MRRSALCLGLFAIILCGSCRNESSTIPYEPIDLSSDFTPTRGPNAFDRYARLAERAERTSKVGLDARPTPGNRQKDLREMHPLLVELENATRLECSFAFHAAVPFQPKAHRGGWLKLGRSLVWQVEESVDKGRFSEAARWTVVATTFGLDLGGGAMSDAMLGYQIADGARAALAGHLSRLTLAQSTALHDGLARALNRIPDASATITNEGLQMLAAIKLIQDAHKDRGLDALSAKFYGRSRAAIVALQKFDDERRQDFFRSLLDEQERVVDQLLKKSSDPGATRSLLALGLSGEEKTIAENFFYSGNPWLRMRDVTLARTRLFAITASIASAVDKAATPPENLDRFSLLLKTDPYTGRPLGYIRLGRDFILYSFGTDGKDDRGDSNVNRLEPDVRLEDALL